MNKLKENGVSHPDCIMRPCLINLSSQTQRCLRYLNASSVVVWLCHCLLIYLLTVIIMILSIQHFADGKPTGRNPNPFVCSPTTCKVSIKYNIYEKKIQKDTRIQSEYNFTAMYQFKNMLRLPSLSISSPNPFRSCRSIWRTQKHLHLSH